MIALIVAHTKNRVIGKDGQMPWKKVSPSVSISISVIYITSAVSMASLYS